MSQIIKNLASGPVPPSVATSYTTDVRDNTTTSPGTAVPSGNVIQLLGRDTVQNNDNGIRTDADPNNGNVIYVELTNQLTGSGTTTDNTLTTIATFNLGAVPGVYYIDGNIVGFDTTNTQGGAFPFEFAARTNGAAAFEIGSEFLNLFQEENFEFILVQVEISGNSVVVQVQGEAATTINWNCVLNYRFVS